MKKPKVKKPKSLYEKWGITKVAELEKKETEMFKKGWHIIARVDYNADPSDYTRAEKKAEEIYGKNITKKWIGGEDYKGRTLIVLFIKVKAKKPRVKKNPLIEFYHHKFMTSQSNRDRNKYYGLLNKKENPNDEWLVKDILLMIQNDYDLWEKWLMRDWKKNFERKIKKGTFKKELAIKGLRDNFVPRALTKVKKEGLLESHIRVSKDIKHKVAKSLIEDVLERIKWEKEHGE